MTQRIPHTDPTTNSIAAAYGYRYDGFAQAPIQYKVSFDGDYNQIKDELWTMMQRGFTCSGIEANNVRIDDNFPIIDDNINLDNVENDQYFYHTDHLGSSSWITDIDGAVNQHLQYLPFGESFIDQRYTGHDIRFKFTTKEEDPETGYQYFGARYYSSDLSVWLSVDPLASKFSGISPYAYVFNNPVMHIDKWGLEGEPIKYEEKKSKYKRTHKARHGRQLARYINRNGNIIGRSNAKYHRKHNYVGFEVERSNKTIAFKKGRGAKNGGAEISGPVITSGAVYGGDRSVGGVWTLGFTGTASAGIYGGSFEIGLTFDFRNGFQIGGYGTIEHAVGADLSIGGIINYHLPVNTNTEFSISSLDGWAESYNGGLGLEIGIDGTYGGNSLNPGIDPEKYSDLHTKYETYGFGISIGLPLAITKNKGYTLTTPTFGW